MATMPLAGGNLGMQLPQLGDLRFGQRATGRDEPVAVAVLVAAAEGERSLDVGANKILAEDSLPVFEQLCEELVEVDVRGDDIGWGHRPGVGRGVIDPRSICPLRKDSEAQGGQ